MTTLTFKLEDSEALRLRQEAKRLRLSLSEFLRRRLRAAENPAEPLELTTCPKTGATVFALTKHLPPLTTESVKEMLGEFP